MSADEIRDLAAAISKIDLNDHDLVERVRAELSKALRALSPYNRTRLTGEDLANRFTMKRLREGPMFDYNTKMENFHWTAHEVKPHLDKFNSLPDNIRHGVLLILAFFASADVLVMENVSATSYRDASAQLFASTQAQNEAVHAVTYLKLLEAYVPDLKDRIPLFDAIVHGKSVERKAKWVLRFLGDDVEYATRVAAFVIVERLLFPSAFAFIWYIRDRYPSVLPALEYANNLIARDEALHGKAWAAYLRHHCKDEVPADLITEMIREATERDIEFAEEMIPEDLWHMNKRKMAEFVKHEANETADLLGVPHVYPGVRNPFSFVENRDVILRAAVHEAPDGMGAPYRHADRGTDDESDDTDDTEDDASSDDSD